MLDELAVAAALDSGHVAGVALDVFVNEPATENVLFGFDNVVATPHLGASTLEAQEKVALQVAEQMADYLIKGAVTNALNMASVSAEDAPILRPYMGLGARLGSFLGQVESTGLKSVVIELDGRAAKLNADPIVASTLAGLLGPAMESVNMVNAAAVASSNGIALSTIRHDRQCDYETLLRVTINHDGVNAPLLAHWSGATSRGSLKCNLSLLSRIFQKTCFIFAIMISRDLLGIWVRCADGMA